MSFGIELRNILTNDASLLGYLDGGIYYEQLPDNYNLEKNWIVYTFNKATENDTLSYKNAYTKYNLNFKLITNDTKENEEISDYLINMLNNKVSENIKDISFVSDSHSSDYEQLIFINNMFFNAFYV